jgi:N-hydroxyarylamine O-acetyltransferase
MDISAYLQRVDYRGPLEPTAASLRKLHLAHLQSVPFENLDIHLGVPIVLNLDRLFDKIVIQRRGGFCYELNGLFAALLKALGFQVKLLSARVVGEAVALGPEFDHLTLWVECPADGDGVRWLADVGFGDAFLTPLRLDERGDQADGLRAYRIEDEDDQRWLWERGYDGNWARQYRFSLTPRQLHEFATMCEFQQTSPSSSFTHRRVATRATPAGRLTLRDDRLIVTQQGVKHEEPIENEAQFRAQLRELFGLDLRDQLWKPLLVLHVE